MKEIVSADTSFQLRGKLAEAELRLFCGMLMLLSCLLKRSQSGEKLD